jgi:hypothetical protein
MARIYLLLPTLATIAGCATQPDLQLTRPFNVSSETSGFFVRATLTGTIDIQSSQLVIVVKEGMVHSRVKAEPAVTLRPIIAAPGRHDARRVAEGSPQLIGAFTKGERQSLPGAMTFTIPLPPDFNPANQWLVFELGTADRATNYVCETGNLRGPEPSDPRRPGWLCWGSPAT